MRLRFHEGLQRFVVIVDLDVGEDGLPRRQFGAHLLQVRHVGDVEGHQEFAAVQRYGPVFGAVRRFLVVEDVFAGHAPDGFQDHFGPEVRHRRPVLRMGRRGDAGGELGVGPLEPSLLIHDQDGYRQSFHGVVRHRFDVADHVAEVVVEVTLAL